MFNLQISHDTPKSAKKEVHVQEHPRRKFEKHTASLPYTWGWAGVATASRMYTHTNARPGQWSNACMHDPDTRPGCKKHPVSAQVEKVQIIDRSIAIL